jgi:hypothetical protein
MQDHAGGREEKGYVKHTGQGQVIEDQGSKQAARRDSSQRE